MAKQKMEQPARHAGASMETKRAQRAAQSERDSAAARSADGWSPSRRTKDLVDFMHRCGKCLNPSAACRRGAALCARCDGAAGRSRKRQAVRDGKAVVNAPRVVA